jgi:uncharacterized membrane protein
MTTSVNPAVVLLVSTAFLALPTMTRPTLPFGVLIPPSRLRDPAVLTTRRVYRAAVLLTGTAALAWTWLISAGPAGRSAGVVVPALVAVDGAMYWAASRHVASSKRRGGWSADQPRGVVADTSMRTRPVRVPVKWQAPAIAMLLVTTAVGAARYSTLPPTLPAFTGVAFDSATRLSTTIGTAFWPVTNQLVATAIGILAALALPRARPELDPAQPTGSAARYRAYLNGTLRLAALTALCLNSALLVVALQLWGILQPSPIWSVTAAAPLLGIVVAWLVWTIRAGDAGHRLAVDGIADDTSGLAQRDDDRHWYAAGTIYANRRDPALLVHQRIGMRWTLNLGHPLSWLLLAALITCGALAIAGVIKLPGR